MSRRPYIVNAFTAHGKNGNPAGVVLGADGLNTEAMQQIAADVGLSETVFVSSSTIATKQLRFFTPVIEEPLCGHATIAAWSLLRDLQVVPIGAYTQETKAGNLRIEVQEKQVYMEQAPAIFYNEIDPADIARMLGIQAADFDSKLQPQIVSTGIRDLLVPVVGTALAKLRPDMADIAAFSKHHNISGFHVFTLLDGQPSIAAARNFAPADGIPEECATGTSTGALLSLLRHKELLREQTTHRVEQGEAMGRLSYIYGSYRGESFWIGGEATIEL